MAANLSGAHDPDKTTVGIPGQTYTNTVTGETWVCIAVCNTKAQGLNKTEYLWARVSESGNFIANTITYLENLDSNNRIPLRSLDSGMYVLHGYFTSYAGAPNSYTFSQGMLVSIGKATNQSYVQIFYSKDNTIQYLVITDDSVERKDAKLVNMESIANKVTEIDDSADDYHYPSAKSVYDALTKANGTNVGVIYVSDLITKDAPYVGTVSSAAPIDTSKLFTYVYNIVDSGSNNLPNLVKIAYVRTDKCYAVFSSINLDSLYVMSVYKNANNNVEAKIVKLQSDVPDATTADTGKVLVVNSSGNPEWKAISNAEGGSY